MTDNLVVYENIAGYVVVCDSGDGSVILSKNEVTELISKLKELTESTGYTKLLEQV